MTSLITDVMYRCQLPHRPQQQVGNPLQQMVFRLLALNLPTGRRKRPTATPIRLPASLIADAVFTGTHPDGGLRAEFMGRHISRPHDSHHPNAVQIQTETELDNPTSPVPAPPKQQQHDCYIDQHGNCPAADTELCDLHCPYRDEK